MSHEIDFTARQEGAMFSVGQTPWHRYGRVLQVAPRTIEEAMEESGLGWEVEMRPLYLGDGSQVKGHKATVRMDTMEPLGVVGSRYQPLQNEDAFSVLQPLIDQGVATWETAGAWLFRSSLWAGSPRSKACRTRPRSDTERA